MTFLGSQGWRSGGTHFSTMSRVRFPDPASAKWTDFVGSLLCLKRFLSGYSGFPLSSKTITCEHLCSARTIIDLNKVIK